VEKDFACDRAKNDPIAAVSLSQPGTRGSEIRGDPERAELW
jgi:hypothetical protein